MLWETARPGEKGSRGSVLDTVVSRVSEGVHLSGYMNKDNEEKRINPRKKAFAGASLWPMTTNGRAVWGL